MSDIVDELRARALQGRFNLEAADEIEQMRAALSELGVTPEEARAGVARSKAIREERDALRLRIKAAEKERDALRAELDALKAWKEEVERQGPVAEVVEKDTSTHGHARGIRHLQAELLPAKTRLYTCPIPAQSAQEGWQLMPKEVADLYGFMCSAFVPMTGQQEEIAKQLDLAKQAMKAEPKPEVK
jgi:hypothetical protein